MIGGWQGDYDNNSLKRSFYEIDWNKLGGLYLSRSSEQFFEQDLSSNGSFKSETKRIMGKCVKMLRKYLLPEVMLLSDTHVTNFFNNAIKFTQIEHLYLLSTTDAELSVQTSPLVVCSVRRFVIFILGAHLMYSFAQKQDGEDFKTVKQLMIHLMDCFKAEFKGIFASFHRATTKDNLLVDNLSQLNTYLSYFENIKDHKEYKKACAEEYSQTSQEGISTSEFSPSKSYKSTRFDAMKTVRTEQKIPLETVPSDSANQTFVSGNDNKSLRSDLLSESNSIRSLLLEKRTMMNQVRSQGLTYSKIKNTFFDNSMSSGGVNSSFSSGSNSPAKLRIDMPSQNSFQQDTTADTSMSSTVQYMKNTHIYPRLLGDLKQHNELKGLKLIKETHVFSKGEEKDSVKKNSPMKERFYKTKEEEDNINPFSIIDVHSKVGREEVEVTINEVQRAKLKALEEERLREELMKKKAEEQERAAAKIAKEERRKQYENAEYKEEDEELNKEDSDLEDLDEIARQRRRTIKKGAARRKKGLTQDSEQYTLQQAYQGGDSSPAMKSSNPYGLLKPEALDYQKPTIDYLEKTERVFERPSDFPEEEITEYCFKKVSAAGGRKAFLTKLLGEKVYEKVYQELTGFTESSAIKVTGYNQDLKQELLDKINNNLENRKIKNFAKSTVNRESVYYLLKQRASLVQEEVEVDEELKAKVQELWEKVRTAIQMKGFIKRLSNNEISVSFVNLQNNRIKSFLPYFDRNMQEDLKQVKFSVNINNRKKEIACICRLTKKKENRRKFKAFQGTFVPIKSRPSKKQRARGDSKNKPPVDDDS